MRVYIMFAALLLAGLCSLPCPLVGQISTKIIRAEKFNIADPADAEDEDIPRLQVTEIKIGNRAVNLDEQFAADANWLKDLKVTVKNVSGKTLTCVGISFGLLETLDRKLGQHESWGWGLSMFRGRCSIDRKDKVKSSWSLKSGAEVELTYANDTTAFIRKLFEKADLGNWAKAVLHRDSFSVSKGKQIETPLLLPKGTVFLDDEPY